LKLVVVLIVIIATSAAAWFPPLAGRFGLDGPTSLTQNRLLLGLDLRGGVQFVLRVNVEEALGDGSALTRDEVVALAKQAVDRRVNALGVVAPVIAVQGDQRDEILVQLPASPTSTARARSSARPRGSSGVCSRTMVFPTPRRSAAATSGGRG
jgi:preprotein translocase subunit SecD